MKKRIVLISVYLVVFLFGFVVSAGLFAEAADDYKVIKNAVKSPESSRAGQKSVQWFKILVVGKDGDHEKVKITLPVSLVEMMMNACPENPKLSLDRRVLLLIFHAAF